MQISTETFGHVLVAHTPDELNDENTPSLIDALEAPIESGHVNIRSHKTIRHSVAHVACRSPRTASRGGRQLESQRTRRPWSKNIRTHPARSTFRSLRLRHRCRREFPVRHPNVSATH